MFKSPKLYFRFLGSSNLKQTYLAKFWFDDYSISFSNGLSSIKMEWDFYLIELADEMNFCRVDFNIDIELLRFFR